MVPAPEPARRATAVSRHQPSLPSLGRRRRVWPRGRHWRPQARGAVGKTSELELSMEVLPAAPRLRSKKTPPGSILPLVGPRSAPAAILARTPAGSITRGSTAGRRARNFEPARSRFGQPQSSPPQRQPDAPLVPNTLESPLPSVHETTTLGHADGPTDQKKWGASRVISLAPNSTEVLPAGPHAPRQE